MWSIFIKAPHLTALHRQASPHRIMRTAPGRTAREDTRLWMIYRMTGISHLQRISYMYKDNHVSKPLYAPGHSGSQQSPRPLHIFPKIGILWHRPTQKERLGFKSSSNGGGWWGCVSQRPGSQLLWVLCLAYSSWVLLCHTNAERAIELQRNTVHFDEVKSRLIHAGERQWKPYVQAHVSVGDNALQQELRNNITFFK